MDERAFDQDARIALLNEYSSKQRSWAINSLSILVAILSIIQLREIIQPGWIVTGTVGILISQLFCAGAKYLFCARMMHLAIVSHPVPEEEFRTRFGISVPYLRLLEQGMLDQCGGGLEWRIARYFYFQRWYEWIAWTLCTGLPLSIFLGFLGMIE